MNERFILEVTYQNKIYQLPAAFQRDGFLYRIAVSIGEDTYIFEPNVQTGFRSLNTSVTNISPPDPGLLLAIVERLEKF